MDKSINNNGYDYVDLELPSGTLWAAQNVGAEKPSDYGLYFQWGDTIGYTKEQVGFGKGQKKFAPDGSDYKWGVNEYIFTKYKILDDKLELENDAAHVNMGGSWHMPSPDQINELLDNTTSEWTKSNGISGMKFTSSKDKSKFIFIPVAGSAWNGEVYGNEDYGSYSFVWSSMLDTFSIYRAQGIGFDSEYANLEGDYRYSGCSVRGVIG